MVLMFRTQVYMFAYKYVSLFLFKIHNQKIEVKCITWPISHITSSFARSYPVHTWPPRPYRSPCLLLFRSLVTTSFTRPHPVYTWPHPIQTWPTSYTTTPWFTCDHPIHMWTSRWHDHIPFTQRCDHPIHTWPPTDTSPIYTWPDGYVN